jgi:mono/diheme cytochrome c family protein
LVDFPVTMNAMFWQRMHGGSMHLPITLLLASVMLPGAQLPTAPKRTSSEVTPEQMTAIAKGHELFLLNCAHCHAPDATGDEGPDLHGLTKSDARIAAIITNGIKGEMPRFGQKLQPADVQNLIQFLHSLNSGGAS